MCCSIVSTHQLVTYRYGRFSFSKTLDLFEMVLCILFPLNLRTEQSLRTMVAGIFGEMRDSNRSDRLRAHLVAETKYPGGLKVIVHRGGVQAPVGDGNLDVVRCRKTVILYRCVRRFFPDGRGKIKYHVRSQAILFKFKCGIKILLRQSSSFDRKYRDDNCGDYVHEREHCHAASHRSACERLMISVVSMYSAMIFAYLLVLLYLRYRSHLCCPFRKSTEFHLLLAK